MVINLSMMEAEDDYIEAPILLQKIANYVAQLLKFPIFRILSFSPLLILYLVFCNSCNSWL